MSQSVRVCRHTQRSVPNIIAGQVYCSHPSGERWASSGLVPLRFHAGWRQRAPGTRVFHRIMAVTSKLRPGSAMLLVRICAVALSRGAGG